MSDQRAASGMRFRFGIKTLMTLPALTALAITAFLAIDRWTATPWTGPATGLPIIFKIEDAATEKPVLGASLTVFEGGRQLFSMPAPSSVIRTFGGQPSPSGYRSLVRDTRRLEFGHLHVRVMAEGFDDFNATGAELAQRVRLISGGSEVEVVVPLRRNRDRHR